MTPLSKNVRERNKEHLSQKEVKLSLFSNDMILYTGNFKTPPKMWYIINTLSKIANKNHIQKSVAFLYTDNDLSERENNLIYNSIRRNNYPGINVTKEVKDLYTEKIHW